MNRDERIVVVGGGLTGLRAAERLRELKFEGDITILGDEKLPPYHRPALSKQLLQGSLRASDLTLPAYEDLNARWRFGTQVRQLIPNKKTLMLPGGEEITYDGLIIATGVEATRQNGVPYHDPRVLVLRTMSDGLDLERVLGSTKGRVAVVGGGFTGCELAASLRHLSREVTLIGRGRNLLGNVLGPDLGEWLTNMHRDHGVDLALGNSVEQWAPGAEGITLRLTDGSSVLVSCVILAAGTKPMTHWLRGSGLPLDNGVVCEPTCHVVGADDVVAAGDVAQWPNLRFDNVPRRVEHWLNAVEMGRAAAESLLAGRANAEPFCPMPRFWTDQYSARIQAAGMLKLGKDIVKLGTPDEGTGTVYGFSLEGRLMGVVGVDCPSAMIAWGESVSRQNPSPRPRVDVQGQQKSAAAASVGGGLSKKRAGKHLAPPQDKQFQRQERPEHEIGFVEQPAEISGPVGVGAGRVPAGRPQSVVDSFSRMLPVAVRPPNASPPPNGRGPVPLLGGRTMPGAGPFPNGGPGSFSGPGNPAGPGKPAGPANRPPAGGPFGPNTNGLPGGPGPRGPINAPFSDGATSGAFTNGPASGSFPPASASRALPPASASGAFPPASASGSFPPASASGAFPPASASGSFPPASASRALPPASASGAFPPASASGSFPSVSASGAFPPVSASGSFPPVSASGSVPPASGSGLFPPVSASGAFPPVSASGSFPPVSTSGSVPPASASGSFPPVSRNGAFANGSTGGAFPNGSNGNGRPGNNGRPRGNNGRGPSGPNNGFGGGPASRPRNGNPAPPFGAAPNGRPAVGPATGGNSSRERTRPSVPKFSASEMTDVGAGLPEPLSGRLGPDSGLAIDVTGQMALLDANGHVRTPEFSDVPPGRRGPSDSFSGMPPVRRGPEDSVGSMPPARRGTNGARGPQDSFRALPPATRAAEQSYGSMPPARRGPEDSFGGMPPARRAAEESFGSMPPVRRGGNSRGGDSRGATDSFSALPPVSRSTSGGRRRAAEDSYTTTMPSIPDLPEGRRAAHRAEDLTPEFGRPPKRRAADPDLSSLRNVPAMSSVDDSIEMPPVRMPKHGRPEDYGVVPSSRPGPEDSYDRMPPATRSSGGRRRARS